MKNNAKMFSRCAAHYAMWGVTSVSSAKLLLFNRRVIGPRQLKGSPYTQRVAESVVTGTGVSRTIDVPLIPIGFCVCWGVPKQFDAGGQLRTHDPASLRGMGLSSLSPSSFLCPLSIPLEGRWLRKTSKSALYLGGLLWSVSPGTGVSICALSFLPGVFIFPTRS